MIRILWIRHGITKGNIDRRYVGKTDEGLLPQMTDRLCPISGYANLPDIQMVYASSMKRCVETAELIFRGIPLMTLPELRECDFGDFEYRTYKQLKDNAAYQEWIDSGGVLPFPNGESRENFINRCVHGFHNVVRHAEKHQLQNIAMVVHGGTIMSVFDTYSDPHQDYYTWQTANGEGFETFVNQIASANEEKKITLKIEQKYSFIKGNVD